MSVDKGSPENFIYPLIKLIRIHFNCFTTTGRTLYHPFARLFVSSSSSPLAIQNLRCTDTPLTRLPYNTWLWSGACRSGWLLYNIEYRIFLCHLSTLAFEQQHPHSDCVCWSVCVFMCVFWKTSECFRVLTRISLSLSSPPPSTSSLLYITMFIVQL